MESHFYNCIYVLQRTFASEIMRYMRTCYNAAWTGDNDRFQISISSDLSWRKARISSSGGAVLTYSTCSE